MNAAERAEWAAIRQVERDNRLARKMAQAMALDPALVAAARAVHDALIAERYDAWIGQHGSQHTVSVRSVKADEKPRVERLANRALGRVEQWPDVRHSGSHITVELKNGRAAYELDKITERGDGGIILYPNLQGVLVPVGNPEPCKPVSALDYGDDAA